MASQYEVNHRPQQAEISFMLHRAEFRKRQAESARAVRPQKAYESFGGKLVHIETHLKEARVTAALAAVAMMTEIGYGFI